MRKLALALAALAALIPSIPALAATQVVNGGGILTGGTGVNVSGTFYDVTFAEGSCVSLFSGCNQSSDFTFHSLSDANAAAQALLDQLFVDTSAGNFDSNPNLTFGCETADSLGCFATIPYFGDGVTYSSSSALNGLLDDVFPSSLSNASADSSQSAGRVWAVFSLAPTQGVPEPLTWEMMLLGFCAIGCAIRWRKGPKAVAEAA